MCVIFVVDTKDKRPTDEMVEMAFDHNNAGAGIAWREDGVVKWKKGLEVKQIQEECARVPLPYVAHFRIPTVGGARPALCHPFPIEKGVPLSLVGQTKGYVLFHNGHWNDWRRVLLEGSIRNNLKLPMGKWSDSRAMAWLAAHHGIGALEMIDEKAVAFGPAHLEVFGGGWARVNDFWASNRIWETRKWKGGSSGSDSFCGSHQSPYVTPPASMFQGRGRDAYSRDGVNGNQIEEKDKSTRGDSGGSPAAETFRKGTEDAPAGADKQEGVQAGKEGVREASPQKVEEDEDYSDLEQWKWARSINTKALMNVINGEYDEM